MYGQMTAGSWIYIGTQGILQGTYEPFVACANKHFGGSLRGKLLVSGGLGGMGGAQPLAATMAGATFLGADVDPKRIEKRLKTKYIDRMTDSYEEARDWALEAKKNNKNISIGLVSDIGDMLEKLINDNIIPEILTDQTSAHDPVYGYVPNGISLERAEELRGGDHKVYKDLSLKSMARHVSLMLDMRSKGSITFDYGNNLREFAKIGGEMTSLTTVEEEILDACNIDDLEIAATCLPDQRKGEKIVLLSTNKLEKSELKKILSDAKINPLYHPASILVVDEIPKLGSGKTDFGATKKIALVHDQN